LIVCLILIWTGIGIFRIWYPVTDDKHYGEFGVGGIGELVTFYNDHDSPRQLKYFLLYHTVTIDLPQFRRLKHFAPDVSGSLYHAASAPTAVDNHNCDTSLSVR